MFDKSIEKNSRVALALFLTLVFVGCASSTPTIDTGPSAEVTFDGLHEVKGGTADKAWAKPGMDLSQYTKIKLQSVGVEYRPGGESNRSRTSFSTGGPYEITEEQKARFVAVMSEEMREELGKSERFTITDAVGPDVLIIRGGLLDVVSYVPPEQLGRGGIYLSRIGEATLVLELRDSITDAILVRAVDRRAAEPLMNFQESNRVSNTAEVRRVAKRWASLLRNRLDEYGAPSK
jgi:hypothetical protein